MKSIVQEGSSVSKAVESAWQTAGKPKEFTVKILEEPQHNFIGMTTRSAKIALFFKSIHGAGDSPSVGRSRDTTSRTQRSTRTKKPSQSPRTQRRDTTQRAKEPRQTGRQSYQKETSDKDRSASAPDHSQASRPSRQTAPDRSEKQSEKKPLFDGIFWTDEMIAMARDWLQKSLLAMDLDHLKYKTDVNRLYLKVFFDEPVNNSTSTERQIFRSFALLLMQHMRNQLKRPLKGFKVVLSRGEAE